MLNAVYPGTFDPLTNGHLDLIARASRIFPKVYVGVATSAGKHPLLSLEERLYCARLVCADFANVERKIDSVNQGLCDGFYQQAQLVNGTNMAMANGFAQAELSRSNQQAALMQQLNAMQMQAANCCCENRAAIEQVRYDMAAQACDTRNTVQNATRDIIDNANSNSRAILDFLTQSKLSDLQAENQGLKLAASQAAQNSYLVSQLRPSPIPAYTVQNPYCCNQFACCGC